MSTVAAIRPKPHYPPGPVSHPVTGMAREFQRAPLPTLCRLHNQYGHAVRFRFFGPFYGYLFTHPEHYQHILQTNNPNYTKMPHPTFIIMEPLAGKGLLTNDGESWLRQRRLAQPAFHRKQIADFAAVMTDCAAAMLDRWAQQWPVNPRLDVDKAMMALTLQIVGQTLFSLDLTAEARRVGEAFTEINRSIADLSVQPFSIYTVRLPFWPSTRRYRRQVAILDEVINRIIAERRAQPPTQADLLGMLMAARDEATGAGMDDKQLRDEVGTLLVAGHETTANLLTWAFSALDANPAVRHKLLAELDAVLGGRIPTVADVPNLPYTRLVLDETLRLYPPAYAMARWGNAPDRVGDYDIPANAAITLTVFYTHRSPDFWENPLVFDPERFTPERSADRPKLAYLPFGAGPRQCIGKDFALLEATLLLAMIAQRFELQVAPGHLVELDPQITLRPKNGLPVILRPR